MIVCVVDVYDVLEFFMVEMFVVVELWVWMIVD